MIKKKRKKSPQKIAKAKAWKAFSLFIRISNADSNGIVKCVTCNISKHWKEVHAGHYVDGRNNTVLFNEKLVHPQCFHCNSKLAGCLAGNKIKYTFFMKEKYGYTIEELNEIDNSKFHVKKYTISELQEIEEKYKKKVDNL